MHTCNPLLHTCNPLCMLGWWIKLAVSMQRLNNHSGVMQILSALQSSSVFRSAASLLTFNASPLRFKAAA